MTNETIAVEALDLEPGDIILGHAEGQAWRLPSEVVRVEACTTHGGETLLYVLLSTKEGRRQITIHRYSYLEVLRG